LLFCFVEGPGNTKSIAGIFRLAKEQKSCANLSNLLLNSSFGQSGTGSAGIQVAYNVYGADSIISRTTTGGAAYYVYNGRGDVVQLVAFGGAIAAEYDYDAFGNLLEEHLSDTNPFRYCGEYWDNETKNYYLRSRYYRPKTGRFTQSDIPWQIHGSAELEPVYLRIFEKYGWKWGGDFNSSKDYMHFQWYNNRLSYQWESLIMKKYLPIFLSLLLFCGCVARGGDASKTGNLPENIGEASSEKVPQPQTLPQWHYYLNRDGLYRVNRHTEEVIKINNQDYASDFVVSEEWIYFNDNNCLYRMGNENQRELVLEDICDWLSLKDEWLFYGNKNGVFKVKPDGSGKEQIIQTDCVGIAISDNYIFYTAYATVDEGYYFDDGPMGIIGQLHRTDIDGNNDVNLGFMVRELKVYKNIVYFSDMEDDYYYSMDPETTERMVFYKEYSVEDPCFYGDFVFFIADRNLHRMSLSSGAVERFTEVAWPSCNGVLDGYVYITTNQDIAPSGPGLYKMCVDGNEPAIVDIIEFNEA
jgi:RHS repeat-associated protein